MLPVLLSRRRGRDRIGISDSMLGELRQKGAGVMDSEDVENEVEDLENDLSLDDEQSDNVVGGRGGSMLIGTPVSESELKKL